MNWHSKPFVFSPTGQEGRSLTAAAQILCQNHVTFLAAEVLASFAYRNICNLSLKGAHKKSPKPHDRPEFTFFTNHFSACRLDELPLLART